MVRPSNAIVEYFWENEYNESIIKRLMSSLKIQCDTALGGGAAFNGMYELVKSCTGSDGATLDSADSGYGTWKIVYSCNTCTAKNIKKDVEDFKNSCAEQCRLTDYVCSFTNGDILSLCPRSAERRTARFQDVRRAVRARRKDRLLAIPRPVAVRVPRPVLEKRSPRIREAVLCQAEAELLVQAVRAVRGNIAMWPMRLKGNSGLSIKFIPAENLDIILRGVEAARHWAICQNKER